MTPTGKSVSVSFRVRVVRAVRAGEAKLRVRVSGDGFCRWGLGWPDVLLLLLRRVLRGLTVEQRLQGFKDSGALQSNVSRVLRIFELFRATAPGF